MCNQKGEGGGVQDPAQNPSQRFFCITVWKHYGRYNMFIKINLWSLLKPLDTFWTEQKLKLHKFTNNLQGLQKVMVKDVSWNIITWNALLFEKTLKQLSILDIENNRFILNTCHDTAKRAETRVGFPVIFSRLRWPIEPKFSQVCYFIYKLWYTKCGPLENTVYRCCVIALTNLLVELSAWSHFPYFQVVSAEFRQCMLMNV